MKQKRTFSIFLLPVVIAALMSAPPAPAVERGSQGDAYLLERYQRVKPRLEDNNFGFPLSIESSERDGRLHVDVYGIFEHPIGSVIDALKIPENWCDIVTLHPNIKACTYRELPDVRQLTFYGGRKTYQAPDDAYQFTCRYRIIEQRREYLHIVLDADKGPLGTREHRLRFEALPLDAHRTFVQVSFSYASGTPLRIAEQIYFSTLGRSKIGFTITGIDEKGSPLYIGGSRGVIERNTVRYYLAIHSFLRTAQYPEQMSFSRRIREWYDLTSRFTRQLYEMDRDDYLAVKKRERENQVMLQRKILSEQSIVSSSSFRDD